nr:hypothetical protein CFP56_32507 [Quercus suber]
MPNRSPYPQAVPLILGCLQGATYCAPDMPPWGHEEYVSRASSRLRQNPLVPKSHIRLGRSGVPADITNACHSKDDRSDPRCSNHERLMCKHYCASSIDLTTDATIRSRGLATPQQLHSNRQNKLGRYAGDHLAPEETRPCSEFLASLPA